MWKLLDKEVDLGEPTFFLDHVFLVCTQGQCARSKDIVDNCRTMFESRISAGGVEKLPTFSLSHSLTFTLTHALAFRRSHHLSLTLSHSVTLFSITHLVKQVNTFTNFFTQSHTVFTHTFKQTATHTLSHTYSHLLSHFFPHTHSLSH